MASLCVFLSPSAAAAFRLTNGTAKSVAAITLNMPLRSICVSPWFDQPYLARTERVVERYSCRSRRASQPPRADGRAPRTWYAEVSEFDRLKMFRRSPRLEGGIHDKQAEETGVIDARCRR